MTLLDSNVRRVPAIKRESVRGIEYDAPCSILQSDAGYSLLDGTALRYRGISDTRTSRGLATYRVFEPDTGPFVVLIDCS